VGRKSLIEVFLHNRFPDPNECDVVPEDTFCKEVIINGHEAFLIIHRELDIMEDMVLRVRKKFDSCGKKFFVFDLTRVETLDIFEKWFKYMKLKASGEVVLLGNKADIMTDDVALNRATKMAKERNWEVRVCSAKNNENVEERYL
jgi:hypothetical protein